MRDDPYPARFYGRQNDEPLLATADLPLAPLQFGPTTQRLLLILVAIYLIIAIFFMATVASYAAPTARADVPASGCQCSVKHRPY